MQEYFSLFGLPERYTLDSAQLEAAYRNVQAQVHPDRFAHRPEAERRVAMQWATLANEAFRTLKSPLNRARYLLERRGYAVEAERNTGMSHAFLMQQMEWREAAEEASGDAVELQRLQKELARDERVMLDDLKHAIDEVEDLVVATELVRRLMFMEKLRHEIDDALAQLDN
ncbi:MULTISPECIES: Fe-S protein assembly co-chaperone HscB [unclassified Uliginosibacterium]|uniref:Fe-S protein assembly co-chaperone HscB n=1 Tax=unclassified Uliginosibacterium TaxID=2621521 RepID=UPI000C7D2596|nr:MULTISPECIES: Fe-S protein assembly co-chaperone HscB [unclassified Uliginosibacterium]MDO6385496.1 Fe-S protein assembly co-chaperone HscB [Uliginosibacterium sp. 31-12]PLK47540.1 Fe-S protein assembly co-chaperone HscB [Uliginosibacterium sp. TH139]